MKILPVRAFASLATVAQTAQASLMSYTFSGTVSAIISDFSGTLASTGINVGDPVSYTYLIDLDAPGSYTTYDGTLHSTATLPAVYDYFFTEIVSARHFTAGGGTFRGLDNIQSYNYGYYPISPAFGTSGDLTGGPQDETTVLSGADNGPVSGWTVGMSDFYAYETGYDALNQYSEILARLTLTSIEAAVPEPPTLLALLAGIVVCCHRADKDAASYSGLRKVPARVCEAYRSFKGTLRKKSFQ